MTAEQVELALVSKLTRLGRGGLAGLRSLAALSAENLNRSGGADGSVSPSACGAGDLSASDELINT